MDIYGQFGNNQTDKLTPEQVQAAQQAEAMAQQRKAKEMVENATAITCEVCGSPFFKTSVVLNEVSPLVTGESKPTVFPMEIYTCEDCGSPTKKLGIPPSLMKLFKKQQENGEEE